MAAHRFSQRVGPGYFIIVPILQSFTKLFLEHQEMAESLSDQALLGIFYGWLGVTLFCTGRAKESLRI